MGKKLYILSIDGGGLKGLIAIRILKIIEEITGNKITETFDLIGGTSTGGLIAAALTVKDQNDQPKLNLEQIESMYLDAGQAVFKNDSFQLSGQETDHLNDLLHQTFEDKRIAETLLPIFVPTFDLNEKRIIVFKTRSALQEPGKNIKLFDVCRATSALPPVFPTYKLEYHGRQLECVDSAHHLRNPAIAVLAEAWKHKSYYLHPELKEEDIVLLSVSTGNFSRTGKNWSTNIQQILPEQNIATRYIQEQNMKIDMKKINYMRVDLSLGSPIFNLMKFAEITERLNLLSKDAQFSDEIRKLLSSDQSLQRG
jgi:patatin-like phospholipase/acyl hydrolase